MQRLAMVGGNSLSAAVSRWLGRLSAGTVAIELHDSVPTLSEQDALVFVRESPASRAVQEENASLRDSFPCPWAELSLEEGALQFGPIFHGKSAPCWRCWQWRRAQGAQKSEALYASLDRFYATSEESPGMLWLPSSATMAASWILQTLLNRDPQPLPVGTVLQWRYLSRQVSRSRVVAVHGCPVCDTPVEPLASSHSHLADALAYLWPHRSPQES